MSSTTTRKTVRFFDGSKFDTYTVGSKKHRRAEERRAAFEASKEQRHERNVLAARWARSKGVVPNGAAWQQIREAGDAFETLSVKALKAANKADGLTLPKALQDKAKAEIAAAAPVAPKKAKATKAVKTEVATEAKPKKAKKSRSKAARKAYRTRVANGHVHRVNGRFAKAGEVEAPAPEVDEAEVIRTSKKALFYADLRELGVEDEDLLAKAWKAKKAKDKASA